MPPESPRYIHEITLISATDITDPASDPTSALRQALTGESTVRKPIFQKPSRIASANGMLYITDTRAALIHVFDVPRRKYFAIGYRREGKVVKPIGVALDQAGNVYVADQGSGRVVVYDRFGLFSRFIGDEHVFDRLTAVAVTASGDRIYLLDTGGVAGSKHEVIVFDRQGLELHKIGRRGSQPGEFNLPTDIAIAPGGEIVVLDAGNFKVQWFEPDGSFIRSWGEVGNGLGQFARPKSMTIDPDGLVYVTDGFFSNFQVFDQLGNLLLPIGEHASTPGIGQYALISGIGSDNTSRIFVLDQYFKKLEVFRKLTPKESAEILGKQ